MGRRYNEVDGDDLLVGSVVADRYHIAGVIGRGSTGTVFGVEHIHLGRRAAMKVLRPRYADADTVHRVFHGDARAAWSVVHPCLAEVFDLGTLPDGCPFFVMEYLEGETLATRMSRERLSLAAAVDVMMQILSALEAIHARALLLRELRPENVYLAHRRGCRPVAKILDFGLARLAPLDKIREEWESVASGRLAHPFYLSPERTRSEHGVEPASDLFVASVVFYEALTGQKPFAATSFNALMLDIARASPAALTDLRADIPPELDAFVRRALSGNPRARPASAKEMQDELRRVFEGARRSGGSASVHATAPPSAAAPGVPSIDAAAATPREQTLVARVPEEDALPRLGLDDEDGDVYAEQTETNHRFFAPADEASAENPQKTVRPPPSAGAVAAAEPGALPRLHDVEEQTETMQLTPELRARLDQMAAGGMKATVPPSVESVPPPPTQRLDKPR